MQIIEKAISFFSGSSPMNYLKSFFILLVLLNANVLWAQKPALVNSRLAGRVVDDKTKEPLPGAQAALAHNYVGAAILTVNTGGIYTNSTLSSGASTDARKGLILTTNSQLRLNKFAKTTSPFTDYIPVLRYAEVLLNYAEAAAETNDLTTARALLAAVRNRADASYTFPPTAVDLKADLIQTILTERRIELLGEGFRTFDIQRRNQPFPAKTGGTVNVGQVLPTAENYIWPIPADEQGANNAI